MELVIALALDRRNQLDRPEFPLVTFHISISRHVNGILSQSVTLPSQWRLGHWLAQGIGCTIDEVLSAYRWGIVSSSAFFVIDEPARLMAKHLAGLDLLILEKNRVIDLLGATQDDLEEGVYIANEPSIAVEREYRQVQMEVADVPVMCLPSTGFFQQDALVNSNSDQLAPAQPEEYKEEDDLRVVTSDGQLPER